MIGFDEALAIIVRHARPLQRIGVGIDDSQDLVLAADVVAAVDSPRGNVSAMDGYAVREVDLAAVPVRMPVVGSSFAGQAELPTVKPGTCARIFTGGALPAGTDRVIVQEVVRRVGDEALFEQSPGPARHVRLAGSDFCAGQILVPAGSRLGPRAVLAAAAADVATLDVWRRPNIVVLSTGDELAEPGQARNRISAIPESVSFGVAALARAWGGRVVRRATLADDKGALDRAAEAALKVADLVVVTGGASVGERDFAKAMFQPSGIEFLFSKVAIKPGKPVWFGSAAGKLVLGLPGNPTSAMVTARLFLAPLIAGLSGGEPSSAMQWKSAPLATALGPCGDRDTFVRACWSDGKAEPLADQDSGAQRALAAATLLVRRPARQGALEPGSTVEAIEF